MSGKARHPWRWILRSGKAKLDGNTLCISEGFNEARTQKHVTRGCGFCVQARQTPTGILCVFPRGLTKHEHRSTSPVAMDFAFRQGEARREYFVYFRELQRSLSGKARHPWRWILRSGKANPDGNTLCISKGFNEARTQKHVTRGDGFCVQARRSSTGILCVFPRASTKPERKRRVTAAGCACCEALYPMWRCCAEGQRSRAEERRRRRGR